MRVELGEGGVALGPDAVAVGKGLGRRGNCWRNGAAGVAIGDALDGTQQKIAVATDIRFFVDDDLRDGEAVAVEYIDR